MENKSIDKVCQHVYRRFPSLKNKRPKVSKQDGERYLLVFSGSNTTEDGKTIQQTVRVVATSEGQIIKTSMSR